MGTMENIDNTNNINYEQNINNNENFEEASTTTNTTTNEENEKKSNTSTYVYGGIGITGLALITGLGYKSYRNRSQLSYLKEKALEMNDVHENEKMISPIAKLENVQTSRKINKETNRTRLSFSFKNTNSVVVDVATPIVEDSIYSDNYYLPKNRAYKCLASWTPQVSDEIVLRRGDLVCVKESFNDGYSLGRNLSTKFDGVFPTCCLARQEQHMMGSELIHNGKFTSILKRTSSKSKSNKRARRASRGISILPGWNNGELASLLN